MFENWDADSVGADEVVVDESGNPLVDEDGEPIEIGDTGKIEVCYKIFTNIKL